MSHHSQRKKHTWIFALVTFMVAAIVTLIGVIAVQQIVNQASTPSAEAAFIPAENDFTGRQPIEPARPMPDFTLTDQHGKAISLSDLQGQPVLMSWGFTNCPDICPLTLLEFKKIREALGEDGDAVHFVFISVDGARDTPDTLARYFTVRDIDDFMIGMTGPEDALRRITVDYGVQFAYSNPDDNGRYNVNHTAGTYLLNAEGEWITRYAYGTEYTVIAGDLAEMVG